MKKTTPTPLLTGTAALAAEARARIAADEAEIAAELGETPPLAPTDELAAKRAQKESQDAFSADRGY